MRARDRLRALAAGRSGGGSSLRFRSRSSIFALIADQLRSTRLGAVNPHDIGDRMDERDPSGGSDPPTRKELHRADLAAIFDRVDGLIMLPGWSQSSGAV